MLTPDAARMLADYKKWANQETYAIVLALPPEEIYKERVSLFKNIARTLNHIYVVDLIWQAHVEGRPHGIAALNTATHEEIGALWEAQQAMDDWYIAWAAQLTEAGLAEDKRYELIGGNTGSMSCAEILLHAVNHGSYHRGFVSDLLTQIPAKRPTVDLPVYKRVRAAAAAAAA
ncbi:MAG TPA: DinB family protein [Bordetella sp.]